MSEYWKSLPRKFCEFCKCWFADNRVSIEFHERGKGHQENVKKKLKELRKKGQKQYETQRKLEKDMKKIEEAALKAFQKDVEKDPSLHDEYTKELARKAVAKQNEEQRPPTPPKPLKPKTWYEARSPERSYLLLESRNRKISMEDAKKIYSATTRGRNTNIATTSNCNSDLSIVGPQSKPEPYGKWVPVVKEEDKPKIDLQLPQKSDNHVEINITVPKEKPPTSFKEKTVGSLSSEFSSCQATFKKRKNISDAKRNVRRRVDDNEDD
ncbi:WW domain-binding protein 4 [Centruroides vittatus]|uniref:WW domain-binding protein 4 n=1 Tax=Centruroides vittatus TaxID=120091 RepID=UPI00350FC814